MRPTQDLPVGKHAVPLQRADHVAERFGLSKAQLEQELDYLDIDQSMAGARGVVLPYAILLVVLLGLMLPYSPRVPSLLWAGGFAAYILARWRMNRQYAAWSVQERKARLRPWHRTMVMTALLFGAVWGAATVIAFPGSPMELRLLWTVALTMVVAGAPRLLTMPQFMALVAAIVVPACVAWLAWGGWLGVPMTSALLMLAGLFVVMARHAHRGLREKFELRLHSEHLARELARRNASLEQMAQSRTLLLAAASHDLRQPVHALGLLMEIIQRTVEPQALRRRLSMATDCVESLSEMLTNLLDFTRMDSGHFPVVQGTVPLQDVLDEAQRTFGPIARRKGLDLHIARTAAGVQTDLHLLRRMLFNLLSNAIKYTRQGRVHVHAEVRDDQAVLHVEDTGVGIAPDRLNEIFRDYVTSDAQSPRFDTGIGLGLGIVRRCAHLLGHPVTVRSEPGQGSRFSIGLGAVAMPDAQTPDGGALAARLQGVVAVIENDPATLEGLSEMLRDWGCTPVAGATPLQVQGLLDQKRLKPRLILSDLHLGADASGFEAIDTLRRIMGSADTPAVMLTGDLSPSHQARAATQNIRIEHKPMRPTRLREVLGTLMETAG